MTVMPKVLWKNGVRYGSEWVELEIGNGFEGVILSKNNKDGTATLFGYLLAVQNFNYGDDVTLFGSPKRYKFAPIDLSQISSSSTTYLSFFGYPGYISNIELKPVGNLDALHGMIRVGIQKSAKYHCMFGVNARTFSISPSEINFGLTMPIVPKSFNKYNTIRFKYMSGSSILGYQDVIDQNITDTTGNPKSLLEAGNTGNTDFGRALFETAMNAPKTDNQYYYKTYTVDGKPELQNIAGGVLVANPSDKYYTAQKADIHYGDTIGVSLSRVGNTTIS